MKSRSFTLIEILVVLSIIAVVMGLLIPAASTVLKRASINKTRTAIRTLQMAVKQYEATYGTLPFTESVATDTQLSAQFYNDLLATLGALSTNISFNPRRIKFLELDKNNNYRDAWDNDFSVSFDMDYTGEIDDGQINGATGLSTNVVIWSNGPDELDNAADADPTNEDNINSWD